MDDLLTPYRQGDLDQIGRRFGLTLQAYYSRDEVRAAMAQNLAQADAVRYALARLDAPLRDAYEWLRPRGGCAPSPRCGAPAQWTRWDSPTRCTRSKTMRWSSILSTTASACSSSRKRRWRICAGRGARDSAGGIAPAAAPHAVKPPETSFLWDVAVLVAAAQQQEIELTRSGSLPKRAAQRLIPLLTGERTRMAEDDALDYVELLKQEAVSLASSPRRRVNRASRAASSLPARSSIPGRGTISSCRRGASSGAGRRIASGSMFPARSIASG